MAESDHTLWRVNGDEKQYEGDASISYDKTTQLGFKFQSRRIYYNRGSNEWYRGHLKNRNRITMDQSFILPE